MVRRTYAALLGSLAGPGRAPNTAIARRASFGSTQIEETGPTESASLNCCGQLAPPSGDTASLPSESPVYINSFAVAIAVMVRFNSSDNAHHNRNRNRKRIYIYRRFGRQA